MFSRSPLALSHLKFRHLMLIDFLVEFGTIHKAARQLSVSQPAATAMLNNLEDLLGFPLFVRSPQGVVPTTQARAVVSGLRTILNEFDDFVSALTRVADGSEVFLRVGVVPQAFIAYLPRAIEIFRNSGGCAIRTSEGTAEQLLDLLLAGELDCVIGRLPHDGSRLAAVLDQLAYVSLYDEDICIVACPSNASLGNDFTYATLASSPWVLQREDSSVRRALAEAFLRKGVQPPKPVVETSSYIQNLAVVAKSNLFTVAPRRAAELQQELGLVKIIEFALEVAPMQVSLITRKSSSRNTSLSCFQESFLKSLV